MTASLPLEVQQVFDSFITTEFTTVDSRGRPICWPLTPYYEQGDPCIDVTTALGYPKKAEDARANPKVSLLFSDPTGSGMDDAPQVLVQGTADVDARDLEANRERYTREALVKLPGSKDLLPPKPLQRLFSFYFTRLYIHVRPERVYVWPGGDPTREPQLFDARMEEVRSGHDEEPAAPHASTAGTAPVWDERMDELGGLYPDGVLSLVAPDGFPFSVRVPHLGGPGGAPDPARRRRARSAGPARPRVRHGPRPRSGLLVAAELPGARRPRGGGRRLGPRAAADGGRARAAAGVEAGALPAKRPQDGALLAQGKKNETRT